MPARKLLENITATKPARVGSWIAAMYLEARDGGIFGSTPSNL